MKARDLRIGNILKKDGIVVTIDGRSIFDIWSSDISSTLAHPYEAIPLTPEWLERAGFEELDDDGLYGHKGEPLFQMESRYLENEGKYSHIWDTSFTGAPLQFVHQLQNLYFALTGEELTIKVTQ